MDCKNRYIKINHSICYGILFFLFYSCSNQQNGEMEIVQFMPKENIQILLDSFVKENRNENYVYELYIDKIMPHECNLILYAGKKSLTELENKDYKQTSLAYIMISGIKINIYSGMERYFENSINIPFIIDTANIKVDINYDDMIIWAVKDSFGIFDVNKEVYGIYPFLPFPIIDFIPPKITPKKQKREK